MLDRSCEYCGQEFIREEIPTREIDLLKDHILAGEVRQAFYQLRDMFPDEMGLESYDSAKRKLDTRAGVAQV